MTYPHTYSSMLESWMRVYSDATSVRTGNGNGRAEKFQTVTDTDN